MLQNILIFFLCNWAALWLKLPDGNVEDVGSNGRRDCHVSEAFPGDDDAGD